MLKLATRVIAQYLGVSPIKSTDRLRRWSADCKLRGDIMTPSTAERDASQQHGGCRGRISPWSVSVSATAGWDQTELLDR
jgi:hypothetical protein